MRYSFLLMAASVACALCVHAQTPEPSPAIGDALLHPDQITITGHFEATLGLTAIERSVEFIAEQIEAKRAADVARMHVSPIWDLAFWRYLPTDSSRTLNSPVMSEDDPFLTPDYLKVSARQLDYELSKAERTSQELLR